MHTGSYAAAGVDIAAADRTLDLIKPAVRATYTSSVVTDVGSFGGMFALDLSRWSQPVLVGSVDSVGTKVMVAAAAGLHRGIGFDMVHHAVNDIGVMGAEPLFFLDYYATSHLDPTAASEVICGLAEACKAVGCALIGGELAELPGMYTEGHYDLVGTIVGVVDRAKAIGSYETSILPFEDCCTVFVPQHPVTKPKLADIRTSEAHVDFEPMMEKSIAETILLHIEP